MSKFEIMKELIYRLLLIIGVLILLWFLFFVVGLYNGHVPDWLYELVQGGGR